MRARTSGKLKTELLRPRSPRDLASGVARPPALTPPTPKLFLDSGQQQANNAKWTVVVDWKKEDKGRLLGWLGIGWLVATL